MILFIRFWNKSTQILKSNKNWFILMKKSFRFHVYMSVCAAPRIGGTLSAIKRDMIGQLFVTLRLSQLDPIPRKVINFDEISMKQVKVWLSNIKEKTKEGCVENYSNVLNYSVWLTDNLISSICPPFYYFSQEEE